MQALHHEWFTGDDTEQTCKEQQGAEDAVAGKPMEEEEINVSDNITTEDPNSESLENSKLRPSDCTLVGEQQEEGVATDKSLQPNNDVISEAQSEAQNHEDKSLGREYDATGQSVPGTESEPSQDESALNVEASNSEKLTQQQEPHSIASTQSFSDAN